MNQFKPYFTENLLKDHEFHFNKGTKVGLLLDSTPHSVKPPFCMVGSNRMYESNAQGKAYPLLETMCDFSKPESWLFKILLEHHNETTGMSDVSKLTFTKTELNVLSKAFIELHKRNLVKRKKRQVYMINPSALITNNWKNHNTIWQSLP